MNQNGAVTNNRHPLQTALVATWETRKARGLANRGRIYIPCPALVVGADFLIDATSANGVRDSTATLLTQLGDYDNSQNLRYVPSVVSKGGKSDPTGTRETITGVSIDRRLDVQRRRAEQQVAPRTAVATVTYNDLA